ncbi:hypothetical protein [Streptomyces sp. NBC_00829]|uniref:hypothetical protein n=1 Tax=Streptomyces sp. NBC_00829 TaxID=2903679 RepID=UPI003865BF69|nr:hypothetical protein OG293_14290 [Streptomyces sp. NBC_00829]
MRLRTVSAAALCALTMLLAAPGSAAAADGEFVYAYEDIGGNPHLGYLFDPPSGECITLPEVASEYVTPAHSPTNLTDATATVFTGVDCEGDHYVLRPFGGHAGTRLKLRSVVFF